MVVAPLQTEALGQLCSKDQLNLLNSIDQLRSEGINHYVSLPQIIVCGDQSSGKSSVLEAISGVSFPVQSNTCTRFPTELILRRTPQVSSSVSIVPDVSRKKVDKLKLSRFHGELEGFDGLGKVIEDAKSAMGINTHGKTFSKDLLKVEITGPQRPHLTIVDLPGLIHSPTNTQTDDDVDLIKDVVRKYMEETRSVILAVISAKNDISNQIVLKMAKKADPTGQRTMGIITKPESLISGSESEKFFASLAQNKEVEFRLGWHVLKNVDSETGSFSLTSRDLEEKDFFSKNIWQCLPPDFCIDNLRPRLSNILMKQISSEIPSLVEEIASKLKDCCENLETMGQRRATKDEQQQYLVTVSIKFQSLTKASIDGVYNNFFFAEPQSDRGYCQRLRAVIQTSNQQFARDLLDRGHFRYIAQLHLEDEDKDEDRADLGGGGPISRDEFITHTQKLISRTRGRELPGTFSPMIVEDLFREQCRPWEEILVGHVETVAAAARRHLILVCEHVADSTTSQHIIREIVEPALETITETLQTKAEELLEPHKDGHPITYNHYFTETLQKVRDDRRMIAVRSALSQWLHKDESDLDTGRIWLSGNYDLRELTKCLTSRSEPDMDRFAASEALDCMEAYYKVAMKRFMDDVAIELVEEKLVKVLPDIFSPMTVFTMPPDLVGRIAGESDERLCQREQLEKQLDVLRKGSDFCKRFVGMKVAGEARGHGPARFRGGGNADIARRYDCWSPRRGARQCERAHQQVDIALPPHEHSGPAERIASPDFACYWSEQPASPVNEELLLPSSPFS